jgi:hypothetical protein
MGTYRIALQQAIQMLNVGYERPFRRAIFDMKPPKKFTLAGLKNHGCSKGLWRILCSAHDWLASTS